MKAPAHHGTTAKHTSHKHHKHHAKHHVAHKHHAHKHHVKAHKASPPAAAKAAGPAKPAKPRKLSPGDVALCPAEAVAVAARIAGWQVTDEDVLDLYARCADGPSSGFTIAAALKAGLPDVRLNYAPCDFGDYDTASECDGLLQQVHTLILGVDLPGPHAVTVAPDGCWVSWGRHYDPADFPGAVIEEAWAVSFA